MLVDVERIGLLGEVVVADDSPSSSVAFLVVPAQLEISFSSNTVRNSLFFLRNGRRGLAQTPALLLFLLSRSLLLLPGIPLVQLGGIYPLSCPAQLAQLD
jgi:hypothetical protein